MQNYSERSLTDDFHLWTLQYFCFLHVIFLYICLQTMYPFTRACDFTCSIMATLDIHEDTVVEIP